MINCNECKFINITEEEQHIDNSKYRKFHKCLKFDKRVLHKDKHIKFHSNYIYPCTECDGKYFIPMD